MYVCMYVCMYVRVHVCMYVCMYVSVCLSVCLCVCVWNDYSVMIFSRCYDVVISASLCVNGCFFCAMEINDNVINYQV